MAYTDEEIMTLVKERGTLRYSMLMARFHINPKPGNPIPLGAWRKGLFFTKK